MCNKNRTRIYLVDEGSKEEDSLSVEGAEVVEVVS